ncbi:hypothetical protein FHX82_007011 [Amycolatopsis bartoniae]|uniref:Putative acyl-CoA dehydrogenase FadE17 n=1 Tax=Amycolatopsis bartoniae TaxID=941986 RepID=A0A8H9ITB6_9PSEU|nr:acyl-CoA dehydrogenase family protein [Amycolatopsis bartoniae]MBB2939925.1 hypothetical protein [Amycolatopsis bartoniae]TVT08291.1 acyl-CoA dehydrogenase [Amycolatopsis bartoniae]GHF35653.1 putative acyl-CoA dehydrogenase FadE17 [Amycolatopsis bartoniae]
MELRPSDKEKDFELRLRAWLGDVLPDFADRPDFNDSPARREFDQRWQQAMHKAGWAGVSWPKEFGGLGATLIEQLVYHEVTAELDAPQPGLNFVGLYHAGPTIMRVGTPEQRSRWLPAILRGDQMWCQGFSEPEAGSDLAGIRCRARVEGDHLVVNGSKIWNSNAHVADVGELIVRTGAQEDRHRGLTYLVVDMDTPGITIRNIVQIDGCPEFNEVFFDDVRVPLANVLGQVGEGWKVAMTTLGFERSTAFADRELRLRQRVRMVARLLERYGAGVSAWQELGECAAEVSSLRSMVYRELSKLAAGADPGSEGSRLKLFFAELDQRIGRLVTDVLGAEVTAYDEVPGEWTARYLRTLSSSIAAGASQIQRNIVGERVLGLPREGGKR